MSKRCFMVKFTQEDEQFMRKAINCAREAFNKGEVPIGAVIVADGGAVRKEGCAKVLASTYNLVETLCDATAHAEMQAITAAASELGGKYLKDCTLYVTVEPCPMCAAACRWSQIGRVVWGADDPKGGYRRYSEELLHPKTVVQSGLLSDECSDLMKIFFLKLRD